MSLIDKAVASTLPVLPRRVVHAVAKRYIAGTTLSEALDCVGSLNEQGAAATVDILGEHSKDAAEARATRDAYAELLDALHDRRLDSSVSIKLTALGLGHDASLCRELVSDLCRHAAERDNFIRIDMEDSSVTQATLDLYQELRQEFDNVGPVLQAYLRRTVDDARTLAAHQANVRLCKGIYVEPLELAWKDRETVRGNFQWALRVLLEGGCHVGIATHDEVLAWDAQRAVAELGVPKERYEFQMLLGVEEPLRRVLIDGGHRMRVYVPFGEKWYEYSLRRLRENPEMAGHVTRAMFRPR